MTEPKGNLFRVLPRQAEMTIAAALRQWLPGKPWSEVRRLLKSRRIMVSGNLCTDAGYRLRVEDVVKLLPHPAAPLAREDDVRIRHLDKHLIVVEKPAGITSTRHEDERRLPARDRQHQPTLDELLPRLIAKVEGRRGPKAMRPVRAVHRLDRETSGLMVFARTSAAKKGLDQQFRKHTIQRRLPGDAAGRSTSRPSRAGWSATGAIGAAAAPRCPTSAHRRSPTFGLSSGWAITRSSSAA